MTRWLGGRKADYERHRSTLENERLLAEELEWESLDAAAREVTPSAESIACAGIARVGIWSLVTQELNERQLNAITNITDDDTLRAISKRLGGITSERVRQIREQALYKLSRPKISRVLLSLEDEIDNPGR